MKKTRTSLHIIFLKKMCEISRIHSGVVVFPFLHHSTPSKKLLYTGRIEFMSLLTSGLGLNISGRITVIWELVFSHAIRCGCALRDKTKLCWSSKGLFRHMVWKNMWIKRDVNVQCYCTGWLKRRYLPPSQHLAFDSMQRFSTKTNIKGSKPQILRAQMFCF